jgi:hypothetical protein
VNLSQYVEIVTVVGLVGIAVCSMILTPENSHNVALPIATGLIGFLTRDLMKGGANG